MPTDDEIHRFQEKVSGDETIETTFRRLRQEGHSRLEAIRTILNALDVSLAEAKKLLARVDTWDEARSAAGTKTDAEENDEPSGGGDSVPPAPG